jgi:ankyrin repeat protein
MSTLACVDDGHRHEQAGADDTSAMHVQPVSEAVGDALIRAAREGDMIALQHSLAVLSPENTAHCVCSAGGITPLMWAADRGHIDVVRALLAAGADATAEDDQGDTALDYATSCAHDDIAQLLRASSRQ